MVHAVRTGDLSCYCRQQQLHSNGLNPTISKHALRHPRSFKNVPSYSEKICSRFSLFNVFAKFANQAAGVPANASWTRGCTLEAPPDPLLRPHDVSSRAVHLDERLLQK